MRRWSGLSGPSSGVGRLGKVSRASSALLTQLGTESYRAEISKLGTEPSRGPAGSFVAKLSELGQSSAHSARSAREDVAHKSTIPCRLKLFCALQTS